MKSGRRRRKKILFINKKSDVGVLLTMRIDFFG